jgi:FK506-binding protein 2
MMVARFLLFATLLISPLVASFDFGRKRKQKKTRAREGWRKTKKDGWLRLDLPPDSMLRIGVTNRPNACPVKTKSGDYLSVHYNGTFFSDGKIFDSSILREEPFVFSIGRQQMIEGWEKGLLDMCVGEKRKLVVPSDMGYGDVGGYGSESKRINPGATLVYNVELLDILDEGTAAPYMAWRT